MLHAEFTIRRARPEDAPSIIATINAICAEGLWLATERYVPTPKWERVLHQPDESPNYLLLVAEVSAQIVGWCRVFPYGLGDKSRHVADLGVSVLKEFRGRGIGKALVERAIEWARQQHYEKLTADLFSGNVRATRLFEKTGFRQTGVRYRQAKIGSAYLDEVLMEKEL